VQAGLQFGSHTSYDTLEAYAFNRLSEPDMEVVEEHLLVCVDCQELLGDIDEYIALMKNAAVTPPVRSRIRIRTAYAWAGAAAAVFALAVWLPQGAQGPAETVNLAAFRGVEMTHIHAGRSANLSIESPDLEAGVYRIELVNSTGGVIWTGQASAAGNQLRVHEPKSLKSGVYWVRLYSPAGALLREYGLESS
jgi:hypothetical protein